MEIFFTILIMILVVSISGIITRFFPFQVPLPLMQIAIGAILAWPNFGLHVEFDPDLFLVIFIPPLLFADGCKTSTMELLEYGREIFSLAILLVVVTIIIIGFFIYLIIPSISLIPALALAASLSPTDAIALSGIIREWRIPKKIMNILQGEALMNDASSLIALKFAIAAAIGTMTFNFSTAILELIKIVFGSILAGFTVSCLYSYSLHFLNRWENEELATQIVLLFLLPFASYLIAEHINVSGILAAVTAGMTITYSGVISNSPIEMRLQANNIWMMLEFIFNGMIFLLLGLQLPEILKSSLILAKNDPNIKIWILITDIILIYLALIILRFSWLYFMKKFSICFFKTKPMIFHFWNIQEMLIASLAGVRGGITLAGILSIPHILPSSIFFSIHDKLVFLSAGVILLSLFIGVIILPILLTHIDICDHTQQYKEEYLARTLTAEVAILTVEKMKERLVSSKKENIDIQLIKEVSLNVISNIRSSIDKYDTENSLKKEKLKRRFRLAALKSERIKLYHLRATKKISNETLQKLLHNLDLLEALLTDNNQ